MKTKTKTTATGRLLLLLSFLLAYAASGVARDFMYNGINYTVISEEQKTCKTSDVGSDGDEYPNKVSGELVLPEEVYDGTDKYSLVELGRASFYNCEGLSKVTIPSTVVYIGENAFRGCNELRTVIIEGKTRIATTAFYDCVLYPLLVKDYIWVAEDIVHADKYLRMSEDSFIVVSPDIIGKIKKEISTEGTFVEIGGHAFVKNERITGGVMISSYFSDEFGLPLAQPSSLKGEIKRSSTSVVQRVIDFNANEKVIVKDLDWGERYVFDVLSTESNKVIDRFEFKTREPWIFADYDSKQTCIIVNSIEPRIDDGIYSVRELEVCLDNEKFPYNDMAITFEGLIPGETYNLIVSAKFNGKIFQREIEIRTVGIKMDAKAELISPTSVSLEGEYDAGEVNVLRAWWSCANQISEEPVVTLTGLSPATSYTAAYIVEIEGGKRFIKQLTFTTSKLELDMLDPKCVSESKAIVAAKTNISDEEMNVGFQWKKYDAPASLKPSEGYAAVYDGVLEGCIKNLQSTSYYNVRAFYKDSEEKYYYSDWVTFDPSDFSYFEPTVHTYPAQRPGSNEVTLKGYVLGGTDDVEGQGFEYWVADAPQKVRAYSPVGQEVFTAMGTGQVMTVILTDLKPDTTYGYRAFVKTASGVMYGEEHSFTTESDTSGVESVENPDADEKFVLGYFDMSGRRYDVPQRGFNIIVYSDGTTRKMMHK